MAKASWRLFSQVVEDHKESASTARSFFLILKAFKSARVENQESPAGSDCVSSVRMNTIKSTNHGHGGSRTQQVQRHGASRQGASRTGRWCQRRSGNTALTLVCQHFAWRTDIHTDTARNTDQAFT
jgi:hypothetical protein